MNSKAMKKFVTYEAIAFFITLGTAFGGVLVYGEKRLEAVEHSARADLRAHYHQLDSSISVERDQRQKDIQAIDAKLNTIISILNHRR